LRLLAPRLLPFILATSVFAADTGPCEPTPAIREALKRLDNPQMTGLAARPQRVTIVQELLRQYPTDYFVADRFELTYRGLPAAEREPALQQLRELLKQHPGDANLTLVLNQSWIDYDTPRAMELLKQSSHPRAHLQLADIYDWGKFADRAAARREVEAYFAVCPDSLDPRAWGSRRRYATAESARTYAADLRKRLTEAPPAGEQVRLWGTLWNLEFKAAPPQEHEAVRARIRQELADQNILRPPLNEVILEFARQSYQLANDTEGQARAESLLLENFPKSWPARNIARERFQKANPWPKPDDPKEKRQAFFRAQLAFCDENLKSDPDSFEMRNMRFESLNQLDDAKPEDVRAAARALLAALRKGVDSYSIPPFQWRVARALLKWKQDVDQVPGLVEEGWKAQREGTARFMSDHQPDETRRNQFDTTFFLKSEAARLLLDAAKELKKPEIANAAIAEVEALKPEKPYERVMVSQVLARAAEQQGRKLDALLLYRAALDARPVAPKPPAKDEIAADVDRLYAELGGTAATRELWNKRGPKVEAAKDDGRWETPKKPMPAWELADLASKTWKLKSLEGKTLLINVWATWCGPCRQELPYLEKLHQSIKDRTDLQIISFNIDDELGQVEPFVKAQKLTFPVLLAKNYVEELLPMISIPRNWIVDAKGVWRAEQIGFGHDPEWEKSMLERLEKTKPASQP
jgi:thiol-disulfide isomerase/thioredoxin